MITSGIFFKNFKLKKKSFKIKKKLEKFIAENNSIAQSLKRNYQDFSKQYWTDLQDLRPLVYSSVFEVFDFHHSEFDFLHSEGAVVILK